MKRLAKLGYGNFKAAAEVNTTPPPRLAYLMAWYAELRNAAKRGMHVEPLGFVDIKAFAELNEFDVRPFDTWMLRRLDQLWIESVPSPTA